MPAYSPRAAAQVFSACAEVVLCRSTHGIIHPGILRVRGGSSMPAYSPRAAAQVFSACAEVVLCRSTHGIIHPGILRVRGGSSGR